MDDGGGVSLVSAATTFVKTGAEPADADAEDDKRAGGGEGDKQLPALDVGAASGNQTQVRAQSTGLG